MVTSLILVQPAERLLYAATACLLRRPQSEPRVTQGQQPRAKFYLYCRQNGIWPQEVTGHNPDIDPKWFDRYCPARNVSAKYPPTVLIHGTADTDVPYEEADTMDKMLTRFKVPHKFISVPNGGHGLWRR
jgi:dipeptidyl aminopeptidase/acylaminoacyl peptidase